MKSARLFKNGRSQAVRLPAEFRFEGEEVAIRRDPATGDVILSPVRRKLEQFLRVRDRLRQQAPGEFEHFDLERDSTPASDREWP